MGVITDYRNDPLYPVSWAMAGREFRLPLAWVVKWSSDGVDPIHAAWNASGYPDLMDYVYYRPKAPFTTRSGHIKRPELHELSRRLGIVWRNDMSVQKIMDSMRSKFHVTRYREVDKETANAMRSVFPVSGVVTLKEFLAMGNWPK